MCLASEAGQMDPVQSRPEDGSSSASPQQTTIKPEIKEETADADAVAAPPASASAPFSSASSTSADTVPPQLHAQNACVKNKSRKREGAQSHDRGEAPCSAKKALAQCRHAESNPGSVSSAAAKGAKQTLKDTEEKPRKMLQRSSSTTNPAAPKKKSRAKGGETERGAEGSSGQSGAGSSSPVTVKAEDEAVSPKTEREEPAVEMPELQSSAAEAQLPPCSPPAVQLKEDHQGKEACEASIENCGSRKSERRCKGALYKTLVSEGMLTSLRANIDRGACGAHDGASPWVPKP